MPEFKSWLCHILAVLPLVTYLTSLYLFPHCKMKITIEPIHMVAVTKWVVYVRVPGT